MAEPITNCDQVFLDEGDEATSAGSDSVAARTDAPALQQLNNAPVVCVDEVIGGSAQRETGGGR